MKAFVVGISEMKGIAKKTGKPYAMCNINTLVPVENVSSDAFSKRGFGFEIVQIGATADCISQFANIRFPAHVELVTDMTQFAGRLVPIVVGVSEPVLKSA
ncbi:hypothetical protein HA050_04135 [Iodobacter sp. HSC-16F04]|uniref:Uncharacterized protein n=1 Tax=Iodobacter violaceini TaxID=3044271 RepID=A0ABX0KMG4_9NEIS|nr:hypothetical protein [Iodobacter violacea]NHQ85300.1 hypothetical protein [Iodobacter violacea]